MLENKFSVRPGDSFAQALINRLQDEGDMLARKVGQTHCFHHPCCNTLDMGLPFLGKTMRGSALPGLAKPHCTVPTKLMLHNHCPSLLVARGPLSGAIKPNLVPPPCMIYI